MFQTGRELGGVAFIRIEAFTWGWVMPSSTTRPFPRYGVKGKNRGRSYSGASESWTNKKFDMTYRRHGILPTMVNRLVPMCVSVPR